MQRIPYAFQGLVGLPIFVALVFLLKTFCSENGGVCIADYFAVPIFLPLIAIYKIFGGESAAAGHEILFIFLYWGLVGFLLGFILDLYTHRSEYSPEQRPPL